MNFTLNLWQIVALVFGGAPVVFLIEVVLFKAIVRMFKSIPSIGRAFIGNMTGFIKQ
jgi:hypothetical protein